MDQDEDSRLFLSTLDASTERIFQACAEIMAAEFSAISVASDTETDHQSTSSRLQRDNELLSELNTFPSASQESSYCNNQPRKRRKRSWTTDQDVLEEPSSATQINLSATENTCAFVGWPQTFAFSSYEPGQTLIEFKAKNNFTFAKNFKQHQRKGAVRSNIGSSVNNLLGDAMLPPIAGIDDFAKRMQKAIDILQSLIPSLEEKLANGFETPLNQQNAGKLELQVGLHKVNCCSRRKSTNGGSQSKITLHNQLSEEASWSSPSSSGTSVWQSDYPSSLTASYLSTDLYSDGGDDTVSGYEKVRQSSGKWSDSSQSNTDYHTFSDSSSQARYYPSPSSQGSSESSPRWEDRRVEKGKMVGRMSKFRKKLGTIFHHHHHHHHHHYNDREESDLGHVGFFKRYGKFFHRSGKNDRKKVKADKPQKPGNKSVVKKKQDVGHLRTLANRLIRHTRHSNKSNKVKDDMEILGSDRHKSKKTKKKLTWLPKMRLGKAKVPNKGNVKLKRIATKTAKMILT